MLVPQSKPEETPKSDGMQKSMPLDERDRKYVSRGNNWGK